jgi:hypothetical protein
MRFISGWRLSKRSSFLDGNLIQKTVAIRTVSIIKCWVLTPRLCEIAAVWLSSWPLDVWRSYISALYDLFNLIEALTKAVVQKEILKDCISEKGLVFPSVLCM